MRAATVTALVALACVACAVRAAAADDDALVHEARFAQNDVDRVTEQLMTRLGELELEFHKKKLPLLARRNAILSKVAGFWGRVVDGHPGSDTWLMGRDRDVLPFLTSLEVLDIGDDANDAQLLHNFRVQLHFRSNPFFTDHVIWRDVRGHAHDDGAVASGINWFEGRAPSEPSFFNFFETLGQRATVGRLDGHVLGEIGHVIRYEFWPSPFTYHDISTQRAHMESYEHQPIAPEFVVDDDFADDAHDADRPPVTPDPIAADDVAPPVREREL